MNLKPIFTVSMAVMALLSGSRYGMACAAAQYVPLERLENRVDSSEITFSYTYRALNGNVSMTGQGNVVLQCCPSGGCIHT